MEGVDIVMVWNTLLLVSLGGVDTAGYLQEASREEQTGAGTDKAGVYVGRLVSRRRLFWVKQSRQWQPGGSIRLTIPLSGGA